MSKHSLNTLKFLEPQTLKKWIDTGRSDHGTFAVVDVRDDDFYGGHITRCLHYPSSSFSSSINSLLSDLEGINDVVFHCALSQQRGPSAALYFLRTLESLDESNNFSVHVLRGGFTKWQRLYGKDQAVTAEYDRDVWRYS